MRPGRACASAATTARAAARRATAATTSKSGTSARGPGRASLPLPRTDGGSGRGSRMRPRGPAVLPPPAPPGPPAETPDAAALAGRPAPACRSRTCAESCPSMRRLCRCASGIPSSSACRLSSEAPRPARDERRARAWKCGLSGRRPTAEPGRGPARSSPRSRASMLSCSSFTCVFFFNAALGRGSAQATGSRRAGAEGGGGGRAARARRRGASRDRRGGRPPGPGASPGGRVPVRACPLSSPRNPARGARAPPSARPPRPRRPGRPRWRPPRPRAPRGAPARTARAGAPPQAEPPGPGARPAVHRARRPSGRRGGGGRLLRLPRAPGAGSADAALRPPPARRLHAALAVGEAAVRVPSVQADGRLNLRDVSETKG